MALRLCKKCKKPTERQRGVCSECELSQSEDARDRSRRYDSKYRNKEHDRFYHSKEWRALRKVKLRSVRYRCEECVNEWEDGRRPEHLIQLACEVHHLKPIESHWGLRLDIKNLKADCTPHHNAERKREYGGR